MPSNSKDEQLKKAVELLRFILSFEDEEIKNSAIESVIELLEEEINK